MASIVNEDKKTKAVPLARKEKVKRVLFSDAVENG